MPHYVDNNFTPTIASNLLEANTVLPRQAFGQRAKRFGPLLCATIDHLPACYARQCLLFAIHHAAEWTSSSRWTIYSGRMDVGQGQALPTSYNTMRYLCCLSERISILIGQNAGGRSLILQASSPAVSDTLFDNSQAQRLQNQSVYAEAVYRLSLYR
jgi:hypothetical protein